VCACVKDGKRQREEKKRRERERVCVCVCERERKEVGCAKVRDRKKESM